MWRFRTGRTRRKPLDHYRHRHEGYADSGVAFRMCTELVPSVVVSGPMYRVVSIVFLALAVLQIPMEPARAQDADTVNYPIWESHLTAKLNAAQAGYSKWTEGGLNSLSATTSLDGKFERTSPNWRQTHESRLAFGVLKQDTLNVRKADDIIRLASQVSYRGNGLFKKFNPTAAATIRTQFAPGFAYDQNPFGDGRRPPVKVSDIGSPATFTQSLGFSYAASWGFKQRLGIASKETLVAIEYLRPIYGLRPSQGVRFQMGIESQTSVDKEIFRNVRYKSTLGLFAAFNQEELPDMLWENLVAMKVNSWLSADFEFVALYDRDIRDDIQIKEIFSIGISFLII